MSKRILITGATGFLGSHIAEKLISSEQSVIALKRSTSQLLNCEEFSEKITWVNIDEGGWENVVMELAPTIFIHCAWQGVSAGDRNDITVQIRNLQFISQLLELGKACNITQFIGLGSQAEYGLFTGKVDESYPTNPNNSYGITKVLASKLIEQYCSVEGIQWQWLRLFSFFGEREDESWFIPTVIKKIKNKETLDMTPGMQKYGYMYVRDFSRIIESLLTKEVQSGVYNISSAFSYTLKSVVESIIDIMQPSEVHINFGAVPYRNNQPMLIQGDIKKIRHALGDIIEGEFSKNLKATIDYYLK